MKRLFVAFFILSMLISTVTLFSAQSDFSFVYLDVLRYTDYPWSRTRVNCDPFGNIVIYNDLDPAKFYVTNIQNPKEFITIDKKKVKGIPNFDFILIYGADIFKNSVFFLESYSWKTSQGPLYLQKSPIYLVEYDYKNNFAKIVTSNKPRSSFDVSISKDGSKIAWSVVNDHRTELHVLDMKTGSDAPVSTNVYTMPPLSPICDWSDSGKICFALRFGDKLAIATPKDKGYEIESYNSPQLDVIPEWQDIISPFFVNETVVGFADQTQGKLILYDIAQNKVILKKELPRTWLSIHYTSGKILIAYTSQK
ncbi:hypothetical protein [Kosmotoga sp. DU53]|jgi:hypothetical protein|uniref:hypothetical protein n=1 Tax=Kosmotoga sp. DU53 TaxID=1310160 RepID=UPI0007C55D9E|nr:hypothetical protein [Kosmotoga sp. DU53]OAA21514.1 hypothetical protein DU53_05775 [Kosmotoga sp. DU53]